MSILTSQRLLVVDDEPLITLALEDFLNDMGVGEVKVALKCEAALEPILQAWPTFVILDIYLPDGSGYEIADLLLAQGVPFAFSSGVIEADIPPRFDGRPALGKPIDYVTLSEIIHQVASPEYVDSS